MKHAVTYLGTEHDPLIETCRVEVIAPNHLEAIRKVGPVRDGCEFEVTDKWGTVRYRVREYVALEPLDVPVGEAA